MAGPGFNEILRLGRSGAMDTLTAIRPGSPHKGVALDAIADAPHQAYLAPASVVPKVPAPPAAASRAPQRPRATG